LTENNNKKRHQKYLIMVWKTKKQK
jgi:hypothetical protein